MPELVPYKRRVEFDGISVSFFAPTGDMKPSNMKCSYTQFDFTRRCMFPNMNDWNIVYTSKGLAKRRTWRTIRFLTCALLIVGAYRVKQKGLGLAVAKGIVRQAIIAVLSGGTRILEAVKSRL